MNEIVIIGAVVVGLIVFFYFNNKSNEKKANRSVEMINNGALLIDVRTKQEYDSGHIKGSIHIPVDQIEQNISQVGSNKDQDIIVYCLSGHRSAAAARTLIRLGYNRTFNGGAIGTLKKHLPVE